MKKRIALFAVAIVLILLIGAGMLIPTTIEESISIKAPFQNITGAVLQLERWKQWHPAFEHSDSSIIAYQQVAGQPALVSKTKTISVKEQSPFGIRILETGVYRDIHYSLNLVPQTDETMYAVVLRKKVSVLKSLFRSIFSRNDSQDPILISLKQFIETPEKYYGFPIYIGPVVDTIVISRQYILASPNLYAKVSVMFQELRNYIVAKDLTTTGHPMLYTSMRQNDSMLVMTGIPVNQVQKNEGEFVFQTMPKGKMLIGHFEGQHKDIRKLMEVMRQYITDYSLQPAALPYQKFLDDVIPASPEAKVNCDVYYPIF